MKKKLSYSNVVSTLALVIAIGTGGAWAASQIDGATLQDRSVGGRKLKNDTVKGRQVKESTLSGLMRGRRTTGNAAGTGTSSLDDPGIVRTLTTPVGQFRLGCGFANADARYHNTTPGTADVYMSFVGGDTGSTHDPIAPNGERGYAATNGTGPELVEIRARKAGRLSILRVAEHRNGTRCSWTWELISSG
jgi:hypothetical protein